MSDGLRQLEISLSLAVADIRSMTERMGEDRQAITAMDARLNSIEQSLVRIEERGKLQDFGALLGRVESLERFRWWVAGAATCGGFIAGLVAKLL